MQMEYVNVIRPSDSLSKQAAGMDIAKARNRKCHRLIELTLKKT